jgi:hypothetical protein
VIAAVSLLICLSSYVNACTCGTILPCQAYAGAQVAFVGLVTKTETVSSSDVMPSNAMSTTLTNGATAAHFKIEEAFLGIGKTEVEVLGEGTTCDYDFKEGVLYLVYAYRSSDGKTLHTNICGGTAPLSEASAHVAYLRGLKNRRSGSVFFGRITQDFYNFRKHQVDSRPSQGALVTIESEGRLFRARSNARGEFAFADLSSGNYRVHTVPEANFSSADIMAQHPRTEWQIDIPDHGCLREWFDIRARGGISGQLVGKIDNLGDVWLDIVFADRTNTDRTGLTQARVDAQGRFKFSFVPPGKYLVGFNLKSGPFRDYPYPEFYYPGVSDRSLAKVITVGANKRIEEISLPIPARVPQRTIEGVAVWPNDKPAVNVWIELINPRTGWRDGNGVQTDAHGRFSIIGMEGQTYGVSALVNKGIPLVHSKPIMIRVKKVNSPVRLVIRVP